jgi:hypothetical protein
VGDKYEKKRREIIDRLKKDEADLENALAAPEPDEAQIKELVAAVNTGNDQLFATFKDQRAEEMAILTPVQQGKFLLETRRRHKGVSVKHHPKPEK